MTERIATCRCGQLRAVCAGEPARVSVCHCLDCQRRSGSAFAAQARFPKQHVRLTGEYREWSSQTAAGTRTTFRFCPRCGSTVAYAPEAEPGFVAVAVGAFADQDFPSPTVSVFEERRHPWAIIAGDDVEHRA